MKVDNNAFRRPLPPLVAAISRGFAIGSFLVGAAFLMFKAFR